MTLTVSSATANQFGLFYYGPEKTQVPFGDGLQCVTGSEVFRLEVPTLSDASGNNARVLDYNAPPMNAGTGAPRDGTSVSACQSATK